MPPESGCVLKIVYTLRSGDIMDLCISICVCVCMRARVSVRVCVSWAGSCVEFLDDTDLDAISQLRQAITPFCENKGILRCGCVNVIYEFVFS